MRTFSFVHILLLLVFLLAYQCTQAQDYAVTVRGDTLRGDVKLINYGSDKKVQIQTEGKKREVVPLIQTRMVFFDGEVYKPQKGPNGYAYMKVVRDGFLSIYAFQQNNQVTYDGMLLAKRDGSSMEVPNLNFKKAMKRFLEDCPALAHKLETGDLGRRELEEIVDEYNGCHGKPAVTKTPAAPAPEGHTASTADATAKKFADLEEKVRGQNDIPGKQDALDMIAEIRNKLRRGEKVPNFLIEGLRSSLKETSLNTDLEEALQEIR
jgi:hypothetical protein